ncbi:hypothetical protein BJ322DRAFT_1103895 [Thelephora terrestris]|uniref:NB-ARC domain-containing protein n=1 Tax=Thelephora terrestris TaxID=56493 RepID=A0A9P6HUR2_9AGAM|nr:hypothetical protein BJ322DRAFT_1103895 [Thelephora terrestris]
MDTKSQRPKRDSVLPTLNTAIEALDRADKTSTLKSAKAAFGFVSALLTGIRDSSAKKINYVELGLACADVCRALDRGMHGRQTDQFSLSVFEAIEQLTTTVTAIKEDFDRLGERSTMSRTFHAKEDKETIVVWKSDLNRILHVFNTELAINTHAAVLKTQNIASEIHRTVVEHQDSVAENSNKVCDRDRQFIQRLTDDDSISGESPPPPPRACFGRGELIEKIVSFAESLTPIALIGAGGIGKTSVALIALHHDCIKEWFGENRRFIRCDQFLTSSTHFLSRLSKAIGAGIENPEDLTPLRPVLSSKEMFIVLDNAELILDPKGVDGQEIYRFVEELSQFSNICLVITSRITTIPPNCETIDVPTLSTGAAHDTFYNIYKHGEQSESAKNILKELDFHPLSVTLLATVAHQNRWDNSQLVGAWEKHQTGMLQTEHKTSLATTIELSLTSPMFKELGPDARGLLGVVAFYPQGVDENNFDWLFPNLPNASYVFDKFCILSLTYRSNGFITMLAPLRDHLRPKDPMTSALLCATKERYFARLSVELDPSLPGFEEGRWIMSEDVNIKHLLDVFISLNPGSNEIWNVCISFMDHLWWYKLRQTVLKAKIEGLPETHRFKPGCLFSLVLLSRLLQEKAERRENNKVSNKRWEVAKSARQKTFDSHLPDAGNYTEETLLLSHALRLGREWGDDIFVAIMLRNLSNANVMLGRYEEGVHQAREALGIFERLGETLDRARCLSALARLLQADGQLNAAEEAIVQSIGLLPEKGEEYMVCASHHALSEVYRFKREREKAVHHYKVALEISSTFDWQPSLFGIHLSLAVFFLDEDGFDDAQVHVERAKSYTPDNAYYLGRAALLQAQIWYRQHMLEGAESEALRAQEIFEKLGNPKYLEESRGLLRKIEEATESLSPSSKSDSNGGLPETICAPLTC